MIWTILGIAPTKEKKAITAAYREKLRFANPEEKPEEFMALRAAYEEALRFADQASAEEEAKSPVDIWMEKVRSIYQDFPARIDPECWEAILGEEVCTALDLREEAEDALLQFLMENSYLPQNIWQKLDQVFGFTERTEELYERFPEDFIDYAVINGIRLTTQLPYDLFAPGLDGRDCDAYRRLYNEARQLPWQEIPPVLDRMDQLSERHPYGDVLRFRAEIALGSGQAGRQGLRKLAEAYPDDPVIAVAWACACMDADDLDEAERCCARVLKSHPDDRAVSETYAELLAAKGEYVEAKERVLALMDGNRDPYDTERLEALIRQWNEAIIRQREETCQLHPEDQENTVELAWCYIQNGDLDEARRIADTLNPECADAYAVCNLLGKLCYSREEFGRALEYLQKLEEMLRVMQPDGTEKTGRRIKRLPEILQLEGACLMRMGDAAAALEKLEQAAALAPDDPEIQSVMGRFLYASGDYEQAARCLQNAVGKNPDDGYAYELLSLAQYRLHRDTAAFASIRKALRLQPYDLSCYVIKMQILLRNGAWDQVRATLDYLRQQGAPEDASILWCRGQLAELDDENAGEALRLYQDAAARVEAGENMLWASQLYYRMALLTGNGLDAGEEADRETLLGILDKGLAHDDMDEECLNYKCWLMKKGGKTEEARELFRALEERPNHPLAVERNLAELYYENVTTYAAEALACYEKLLRVCPDGDYCFYAGYCKRIMGDYAGAEEYARREIALAPDDVDGYKSLAYALEGQGRNEEALAQIERALAVAEELNRFYAFLHEHKIRILCRMNRWEDALEAVKDAMQDERYTNGYQRQFGICIQFGKWEAARQVLDRWCREQGQTPQWILSSCKLYLYSGDTESAEQLLEQAKPQLPPEDVRDLLMELADLKGDTALLLRLWSDQQKEKPNSDYFLIHLANTLWQSGQTAAAAAAARKALELLDATLRSYSVYETVYRARRVMALALVGAESEARQELALARRLPLCENCEYCACKDADVFEAMMEEICGNRRKALELYRRGAGRWPDETNFRAGIIRTQEEEEKC